MSQTQGSNEQRPQVGGTTSSPKEIVSEEKQRRVRGQIVYGIGVLAAVVLLTVIYLVLPEAPPNCRTIAECMNAKFIFTVALAMSAPFIIPLVLGLVFLPLLLARKTTWSGNAIGGATLLMLIVVAPAVTAVGYKLFHGFF